MNESCKQELIKKMYLEPLHGDPYKKLLASCRLCKVLRQKYLQLIFAPVEGMVAEAEHMMLEVESAANNSLLAEVEMGTEPELPSFEQIHVKR